MISECEKTIQRWRDDADRLGKVYAQEATAKLLRAVAKDIEDAMHADANARVTMSEAVAISGYSRASIYRLIKERRLANHGTARRPLLRRAELPSKPGNVGRREVKGAQ